MSLFSKISNIGWPQMLDLSCAVLFLGKARAQLPAIKATELYASNVGQSKATADLAPKPHDAALIERVQWAIPRAAKRVPWRSDCLVQAKAAQNWLKKHDVYSEIELGARKSPTGALDAHAWLTCQGHIVTGGDITTFVPFQ